MSKSVLSICRKYRLQNFGILKGILGSFPEWWQREASLSSISGKGLTELILLSTVTLFWLSYPTAEFQFQLSPYPILISHLFSWVSIKTQASSHNWVITSHNSPGLWLHYFRILHLCLSNSSLLQTLEDFPCSMSSMKHHKFFGNCLSSIFRFGTKVFRCYLEPLPDSNNLFVYLFFQYIVEFMRVGQTHSSLYQPSF